MLTVIALVAALILFALAGLNIRGPRFAPEWFAWGLVVLIAFGHVITRST